MEKEFPRLFEIDEAGAARLAGWSLEAGRRLVEGLRTTFEEAARKGK